MKIIQLLPELKVGGVERGTVDLSDHLIKLGHDSAVISAGGQLVNLLNDHGAKHYELPIAKKNIRALLQINNLIKIYSNILFYLMDNNSLINIIKIVNTDLLNIMNKILKIYVDSENHKYSNNIQNKIESIVLFSTYYKKDNLLEHLELFIRKIKKLNNTNNYKLKQILINQDSPSNISNVKYINYITSHISI